MQLGEHAVLVAELLNEVSQARVTLLNADQKSEYDEELRKQQTPEPVPEPTPVPIPVVETPTPTPVVVRGTVTQDFPVSVVQSVKSPRRRKPKEIWKQSVVIGVSVVVFYFFDDTGFFYGATCLFSGLTITNAMNSRVIKELKREIESLKSRDSTGADEPTPPADEPATDD